jgi:hypothetical protein
MKQRTYVSAGERRNTPPTTRLSGVNEVISPFSSFTLPLNLLLQSLPADVHKEVHMKHLISRNGVQLKILLSERARLNI